MQIRFIAWVRFWLSASVCAPSSGAFSPRDDLTVGEGQAQAIAGVSCDQGTEMPGKQRVQSGPTPVGLAAESPFMRRWLRAREKSRRRTI